MSNPGETYSDPLTQTKLWNLSIRKSLEKQAGQHKLHKAVKIYYVDLLVYSKQFCVSLIKAIQHSAKMMQ